MPGPDFKARLEAARKRIAEEAGNVQKELPDVPEVHLPERDKPQGDPAMPPRNEADWTRGAPSEGGLVAFLREHLSDPAIKQKPWLEKQLAGLLHSANQVATLGTADEIAGTTGYLFDKAKELVGGDPVTRTADDYRASNRALADEHIKAASPLATIPGGIIGSVPAAMATAPLSVANQILAAQGLLEGQMMGHGHGNPWERVKQTAHELRENPISSMVAVAAPAAMPYLNKGAGKFADWFADKKYNQLGNLITSGVDRAKMKVQSGTDAVRNLARDAERTGLFKGSNWFSDTFGVPTASRVVENSENVLAKRGKDIETFTDELLGKAEARPDKNQQVDYGRVVEQLEKLKGELEPGTTNATPGKLAKIDKAIEYVKKRAARSGNSPPGEPMSKPFDDVEYEEPAANQSVDDGSEPIDVESHEVHKASVKNPVKQESADNVTPEDVASYEPQAGQLPVGKQLNDQPNATRFARKALPASTTEPNPDELYSSTGDGPENASYDPETYADPPKANLAKRTPGELATRSKAGKRVVDPAMQEPYDGPPAPDNTGPVRPDEGLASYEPDTRTGTSHGGYWEQPNQDSVWTPPAPMKPEPKRLPQNAPEHSVSLREGMRAQKLAAKDVDFDPKVKPVTALEAQIADSRYKGHAIGNSEAMSSLLQDSPENFMEPVMGLREANHDYSVAKEVQYPASIISERNAQHAISPRDLAYGMLSGRGAAVISSRFGRGGVPGTLAKALGAGENAGRLGERLLDASEKAGLPRTSGQIDVTERGEPEQDEGPGILDRMQTWGADAYDAVHGRTPRETLADRNDRMSKSIRKRLEEQGNE